MLFLFSCVCLVFFFCCVHYFPVVFFLLYFSLHSRSAFFLSLSLSVSHILFKKHSILAFLHSPILAPCVISLILFSNKCWLFLCVHIRLLHFPLEYSFALERQAQLVTTTDQYSTTTTTTTYSHSKGISALILFVVAAITINLNIDMCSLKLYDNKWIIGECIHKLNLLLLLLLLYFVFYSFRSVIIAFEFVDGFSDFGYCSRSKTARNAPSRTKAVLFTRLWL